MSNTKRQMTEERFIEIFEPEDYTPCKVSTRDKAYKGLQIIAKYMDPDKHYIIVACEHDMLYSVQMEELIESGITEEDVMLLENLGWQFENETQLAHML